MNIAITIDFGNDYRVSLTPKDARFLYDRLAEMFSATPTSYTTSTTAQPYTYTAPSFHPDPSFYAAPICTDKSCCPGEARAEGNGICNDTSIPGEKG